MTHFLDSSGSVLVRVRGTSASFSAPEVRLEVGDFVGRHRMCAVQLNHPGAPMVSACVVRRGRRLFLEGQGHRPELGPDNTKRVWLEVGVTVPVHGGVLEVLEVREPTRILAVAVADHPLQELVAPYYALRGGRRPDLLPGEIPHPDAVIVDEGASWRISVGGRPFDPLVAGRVWQVAGTSLRTSWIDTRMPGSGGAHEPLVVETHGSADHARISRASRHRVTLRGRAAILLRAAVLNRGTLGRAFTEDTRSFHSALVELQDALRAHGLRDDLIRPDGLGGWELFLQATDRVSHVEKRETG